MTRGYYISLVRILLVAAGWLLRNQRTCRATISFMARWCLVLAGVAVGIIFADWTLLQNPRPVICRFLQTPLVWFVSLIDDLHIIPGESLIGVIVVVPLWYFYWALFGGLSGALLRLLFRLPSGKTQKSESH